MMHALWNRAKARRDGDGGFTLVELLVVIVIIGILVAIAIPVFLNQRQKAWTSATESDLRNAAPVAETFFADNGTYDGLESETFQTSGDVTITVKSHTASGYCIEATHAKLAGKTYSLNSADGKVKAQACA
jgi:type IV pilus assembly protein PilA